MVNLDQLSDKHYEYNSRSLQHKAKYIIVSYMDYHEILTQIFNQGNYISNERFQKFQGCDLICSENLNKDEIIIAQ